MRTAGFELHLHLAALARSLDAIPEQPVTLAGSARRRVVTTARASGTSAAAASTAAAAEAVTDGDRGRASERRSASRRNEVGDVGRERRVGELAPRSSRAR